MRQQLSLGSTRGRNQDRCHTVPAWLPGRSGLSGPTEIPEGLRKLFNSSRVLSASTLSYVLSVNRCHPS